jgi:hypothetical protein
MLTFCGETQVNRELQSASTSCVSMQASLSGYTHLQWSDLIDFPDILKLCERSFTCTAVSAPAKSLVAALGPGSASRRIPPHGVMGWLTKL